MYGWRSVEEYFLFKIFFVTGLKVQKGLPSLEGNVQLTSAERERERERERETTIMMRFDCLLQ